MQDFSNLVEEVENTLIPYFRKIEKRALFNQEKVLNAFHHVKASESDLQGSTGYGYDDFGRDHLEQIYAHTFKADDALVSCLLYTSPSPRDKRQSRMPSSA